MNVSVIYRVNCRMNIREPFNNDHKHVQNEWCVTTPQEEKKWMVHIIKFYIRITK